ncbi:Zn-dependent hydrolase, partial [Herbaspirillum sp. HC18]
MRLLVSAALALFGAILSPALAQQPLRSECLAMANAAPRVMSVAYRQAAGSPEVEITYAGHSTYFIDTPGGLRIATDYSGAYQVGRLPDVVTMNRAHSTHYSLYPDKRIPHVLHGWSDDGKPAIVSQRISDTFI